MIDHPDQIMNQRREVNQDVRLKLVYFISAGNNELYGGRHFCGGRYMSYGQQSFLYDFALTAARLGVDLRLLVENEENLPILRPLARVLPINTPANVDHCWWRNSVILFDTITLEALSRVPKDVPGMGIVHDSSFNYPPAFVARCERLLCMSAAAIRGQAKRVPADKLALMGQGVDLRRFLPRSKTHHGSAPRILLYGRLEGPRKETLIAVARELVQLGMNLTILGGGEGFWQLSDTCGTKAVLIHHIPCHSIHGFLPEFDLVVSSGRGAMEALACDIPVLCAGFGYAGLITPSNIKANQWVNMTGFGLDADLSGIKDHIAAAMEMPEGECRRIAENCFAMEQSVKRVMAISQAFV